MGISNELFANEREQNANCHTASTPNDVTGKEPGESMSDVMQFAMFMRFLGPPQPGDCEAASAGGVRTWTAAARLSGYTGRMAQAQFLIRRKHFARLGVLLVLALSFSQVGAVRHQYAHDTPGQICSDCLSFAPLLAAAGGKVALPEVGRAQAGTACRPLLAPLAGQTPQHSFRSRAPPCLA
jgi:hypothetical protein